MRVLILDFQKIIKYSLFLIVGLFLFFVNFNSGIVEAMENVPILKNIVKIVSIRSYFSYKNNELDVNIPKVEYDPLIDADINKRIASFTSKIITKFYKDYNDENHQSIKINYKIVTDNEKWFTLKIIVLEEMGSSDNYVKYYHIDKIKNQIVCLNDLFKNSEYKIILINEIKRQMEKQMLKNPEIIYFIDDLKEIMNNQNFYFNSKGNIVIVFNKYEVGPGSMGISEFEINKKLYVNNLK